MRTGVERVSPEHDLRPRPDRTRAVDRFLLTLQATLAVALVAAWVLGPDPAQRSMVRTALAALAGTLAMGVGLAALVSMRNSFRIVPTPRHDAVLIQHGVYRRLRHPMYTSVLLLLIAISLHHPSVAVLLVAGINAAFYLGKARYEESLLLAHYPAYAQYRARTWGVVPGF